MRASSTFFSLLGASCLMSAALAQNVSITGCTRPAQTLNITVDAGQSTKLTYTDSSGNDQTTMHVCPGDTVVWTGKQHKDLLAISFAKEGGTDTPADDGQINTTGKHRIKKHIKQNHARLKYPYAVTLTRNGTPIADDPLIIIGQ